jgi:hypothetical protein
MSKKDNIVRELSAVFEVQQAEAIANVVTDAYQDLVKTSDFNELKAIVKQLAESQAEMQKSQVEMQKSQVEMQSSIIELQKSQVEMQNSLTEMQKSQTEMQKSLIEMQNEMRVLARRGGDTNKSLGGLSKSVAYALENEAYRHIPKLLAQRYDIHLHQKLIRTEVGGEEINLFGQGQRNGQDVLVVGETKLRLDERRRSKPGRKNIFDQLDDKSAAVRTVYPDMEQILLIITHYARPSTLKYAEEAGIIVIQSFEW